MRAYPQLKQNLVLAGKETWFADRVHEAARDSGVGDRIQFCGFVSDEDLLQLYNACDLFVFPSFYEGFGLPVLEAMACGRAVVCSQHVGAAGSGGRRGDPVRPVRGGRNRARHGGPAAGCANCARAWSGSGLQRAAHFCWQKTAQRTLAKFSTK